MHSSTGERERDRGWERSSREGSKGNCNEVPNRDKVEAGNEGKGGKGNKKQGKAAEVREMGTNRGEWGGIGE